MKNYVGLIGFWIFMAIATYLTYNLFQDIAEIDSGYKEIVGDEIVLRGDTLMVVDYSIWKENFVLEDGREVSLELVKELGSLEQ